VTAALRPAPASATRCVYCLDHGHLRDEQILARGEHLYLCAPRGQLVEGYLVITPYRCIGCLAHLPPAWFRELERLVASVTDFYARAYGTRRATLYEQGRAGGGASSDPAGGFPLHAHLCALPLDVDVHGLLRRGYARRRLAGPRELASVVRDEPYLYVESGGDRSVYLGRTGAQRRELAAMRLKPEVAALAGFPERGHWRSYPGDRELERLIERWRDTWASSRTSQG
jgi:diadenosine tetraphosphate (Ap4A) HIT family hydrolase